MFTGMAIVVMISERADAPVDPAAHTPPVRASWGPPFTTSVWLAFSTFAAAEICTRDDVPVTVAVELEEPEVAVLELVVDR